MISSSLSSKSAEIRIVSGEIRIVSGERYGRPSASAIAMPPQHHRGLLAPRVGRSRIRHREREAGSRPLRDAPHLRDLGRYARHPDLRRVPPMGCSVEMIESKYGHVTNDAAEWALDRLAAFDAESDGRIVDAEGAGE
jgi:hypothetical protein